MSSDSASNGLRSVDPRIVSLALALSIVLVTFVGPETYYGVEDDTVGAAILGLFLLWFVARQGTGTDSGSETDPTTPASVGEHYRPTTGDHTAGVYRVVGACGDIALLCVGDADGHSVTTGEVIHLDQSTLDADFEGAADPDAGLSAVAGVRNAASGLYWNVRTFF